ncbi:unnamed protein product, partial [Discosporangium mesarthrocarpum]
IHNTGLALASLEGDGVVTATTGGAGFPVSASSSFSISSAASGPTQSYGYSGHGAARGGGASMTAKEIVDGNQEATLRLLWSLIVRYSLSTLVNRDALLKEAASVIAARAQQSSSWPRGITMVTVASATAHGSIGGLGTRLVPAAAATQGQGHAGEGVPCHVPGGCRQKASPGLDRCPCMCSLAGGNRGPLGPLGGVERKMAVGGEEHPSLPMPDLSKLRSSNDRAGAEVGAGAGCKGADEGVLAALLAWTRAVCHGYGVPIENFTASFADGRALCVLLHYYHPQILPLEAIQRTTAHLPRRADSMAPMDTDLEKWVATLDASQVRQ